MTIEDYRESVLKAMREFEADFNHVDQFALTNALSDLYEIIRTLPVEKEIKQ